MSKVLLVSVALFAALALSMRTQSVSVSPSSGRTFARAVTIPTTPCKFEDSRDCFWDAGVRGNGHGWSFWTGPKGHVHYLDPKAGR